MEEYDDIIRQLSWDLPEEVQQAAIESIVADKGFDVTRLFRSALSISNMENVLICLQRIGYPRNYPVLDEMLGCLCDLNDHGAESLMYALETYPNEAFLPAYEKAIRKAIARGDRSWLAWLSYYVVSQKVMRNEFESPDLYDEMIKYKDTFWHRANS